MAEKVKTGFEKFIFPIILIIITTLVTLFVQKYFFSKSPELSYYITQSSPIDTGIKKYYSTTFNVLNTGNVALGDVVLGATFDDTIATVNIQPPVTKKGNIISGTLPGPDSSTLNLSFDLAREEQTAITVVSAGALRFGTFVLKSSEVLGKKLEISKNKKFNMWTVILSILVIIISVVAVGWSKRLLTETETTLNKAKNTVADERRLLNKLQESARATDENQKRVETLLLELEKRTENSPNKSERK